ncbi:methyltransferase domain-containing protein [Parachitinimonas caeni]|uniref:GNAT family N-acetyltransferase n=1 Tax=Parachitinimonas caeni TaxID=3031301 RepID=A0ABT7DRV6_9NEIS|nr:methyltransferase domain-containing protein [Parachitinimonas caeni]MDK2122786.1 GNAT family N-acetyltransferase [Parachitinimonas caeni]
MTAARPYQAFSFPLNAYAHVLWLETGEVRYLHYGLFEHLDESVTTAQERSTELLFAQLPPPCRLLEVGIGVGTTLSRLVAAGYQVTGITPDASQIAYVHAQHGQALDLRLTRLEDFNPGERFDCVMFQESAQYIALDDLFDAVDRLLKPGGTLVVLDEFRNVPPAAGESLHPLTAFRQAADARGYTLHAETDVSAAARTTADWLLNRFDRYRQALLSDLALTEADIDGVNSANQRYRERYYAGDYGYALLRFSRKSTSRWQAAELDVQQSEAIRQLFGEVFGSELTPALWHWKYGDGRGRASGVWNTSGQLVAHYGGIGRPILYRGHPAAAAQIGDVMVAASERGTLSHRGPFMLAASYFLDNWMGYNKPYLLGFGFPTKRALATAARQKLYAEVGSVAELNWTPDASPLPWTWSLEPLQLSSKGWREAVNGLWAEMAPEFADGIIGIRDASWIEHRYFHRPQTAYHLLLLRHKLSRRPQGLIVLRQFDDRVEWMDWIAPRQRWPQLAQAARWAAAKLGAPRLNAWISRPWQQALLATGATESDAGVVIPCNSWSPGPTADELRDRWFLTGGDTDFK